MISRLRYRKEPFCITFAVTSVDFPSHKTDPLMVRAKVGSLQRETKPVEPEKSGTYVFSERYTFCKNIKIDKKTAKPKSRDLKVTLRLPNERKLGKVVIDLAEHIDTDPSRYDIPMTCKKDGEEFQAHVFYLLGMQRQEKKATGDKVPKMKAHETDDLPNKPLVPPLRGSRARAFSTEGSPEKSHTNVNAKMQQEEESVITALRFDSGERRQMMIEALPSARGKVAENYMAIVDAVKRKIWPPLVEAQCWDVDGKLPYPPAVCPIFGVLCNSHIFMKSEYMSMKDFQDYMATFFAVLNGPEFLERSSLQEKLITKLLLAQLVRVYGCSQFFFSQDRVRYFLQKMQASIKDSVNALAEEMGRKTLLVCRTIASASFDLQEVLQQFQKALDSVRASLQLPEGLMEMMFKELYAYMDCEIVNDIERRPNLFTLENAIVWNSAVTAIETDLHVQLTLLREFASVLITAKQQIYNQEHVGELVTHLDKGFVLKILKHMNKDEESLQETDVTMYAQRHGLSLTSSNYFEMSPMNQLQDLTMLSSDMNLTTWNENIFDPALIEEFPFLIQFSAEAPQPEEKPRKLSGIRDTVRVDLDTGLS